MSEYYALAFGRGPYDRFILHVKHVAPTRFRVWQARRDGHVRAGSEHCIAPVRPTLDAAMRMYRDCYYPDGEILYCTGGVN